MYAEIARPDILRPLPSADGPLRAVLPQPHQITTVPANREIYAEGEDASAIYEVAFGAVRLFRLLADGRRQISAFYVAGEAFGFEADRHHHFFAEAVCDSAVRLFARPRNQEAAGVLLPLALASLVRAQEHMLVIGRQTASERLAAFLVDMMDRQDKDGRIELAMPRADIADYLGLTIETVSRTFSRFRRQRLIALTGARTVTVLQAKALRALAA